MKPEPVDYAFTARQANIMQQAISRAIGQTVRGPNNVDAAKAMEQAGLVVLEKIDSGGFKTKPTLLGREAWTNFGLKAAGRKSVCLR